MTSVFYFVLEGKVWYFCRDAVETNVLGTRHAIQLARSLRKSEVGHALL